MQNNSEMSLDVIVPQTIPSGGRKPMSHTVSFLSLKKVYFSLESKYWKILEKKNNNNNSYWVTKYALFSW